MKLLFAFGAMIVGSIAVPAVATTFATPQMVKDIATGRGAGSSGPRDFLRAGGVAYFSAQTPLQGRELYATDGVNARLVADLTPGTGSSDPVPLGVGGGRLIVDAYGAAGEQLLSVDPATGSSVVLFGLGSPLPGGSRRTQSTDGVGTRAVVKVIGSGHELWSTDGTPAGTMLLPHRAYGDAPGDMFCSLGNHAIFVGSNGHSLWRTDGTVAGTASVATLGDDLQAHESARIGGTCYFLFRRGFGWSLWRSDGNGAALVTQQSSATPLALVAAPSAVFVVDFVNSMPYRQRLWNAAAATPLLDIVVGSTSAKLNAVGSRVIFQTAVIENGQQTPAFFLSDGAAAGTQRLTPPSDFRGFDRHCARAIGNVLVAACGTQISRIDTTNGAITSAYLPVEWPSFGPVTDIGGVVIGAGDPFSRVGGVEVWRTDGTAAGTRELHDIWPKSQDGLSSDMYLKSANGARLFFSHVLDYANGDGVDLKRLWRSDGTEAGTFELAPALYADGSVAALTPFGDGILFMSQLFGNARQYRSDGTPQGTTLIFDRASFSLLHSSESRRTALLSCNVGTSYWDLCGIQAHDTQAALVLPRGQQSGRAEVVGGLGDLVLFYISDINGSDDYRGLWRSDGTGPGTFRIVTDLQAANHYGTPYPVSLVDGNRLWLDGKVYSSQQRGLYLSDGTTSGTRLVASLPAVVTAFAKLGSRRVALLVGESDPQLWISDGTAAGTQRLLTLTGGYVRELERVGDRVHFIVAYGNGTAQYYLTDGTMAGTHLTGGSPNLSVLGGFGPKAISADMALLPCQGPAIGQELCAINADGGGLRLVQDIFPGPEGSGLRFLDRTTDAIYFTADDGYHGRELWRVPADRLFADGFDRASR